MSRDERASEFERRYGEACAGHAWDGRQPPGPYLHALAAIDRELEAALSESETAELWVFRSRLLASMLKHRAAIDAIERAMAIGGRDKNLLKKLARLNEERQFWAQLPVSPGEFDDLVAAIVSDDGSAGFDDDLGVTRAWLRARGDTEEEVEEAVSRFLALGAFTDIQIVDRLWSP